MTQDIVVDLGEEYAIKNGLDGATFNVGLYNDSEDNIGDTDDLAQITSEPGNANYTTASVSFTATDISGNWGVDNDGSFSFDFSDTTTSDVVDTAYLSISFTASDTGDTTAQEHLIATAALTQDRDIGSIDTLSYNAGDLQVTLD